MPDMPNIGIRGIQPVKIHSWLIQPPVVSAIEVPVTVNIGTPVVLLPGCVTSHPLSNKSKTIAEDDPKGVKTYCDANAPSFTPLDYTPEDLVYTTETPPPTYESEAPELPATPEIPSDLPRANPPSAEQNEATPATHQRRPNLNPIPTQPVEAKATLTDFLPSPQQVTTTASIAVVATSAALLAKPLADLLLKLVKPAVKKAQKKLFGVFGKKTKVESVRERVLAQRDRNRALLQLRRSLQK